MNNHQQDLLASPVPSAQRQQPAQLISRRRVLGGIAGVSVLAALGGGFALWRYRQSQSPVYLSSAQGEVIATVAWSPDGKRIASGGYTNGALSESGSIRIWDALTGQHLVRYHNKEAEIYSLAWSPDSRLIASANRLENVTRVLNAATGETVLTYPEEAYPQDPKGVEFQQKAVAWSPDGKRLASAGIVLTSTNYSLQSWDALSGSQVITYESSFRGLSLQAVGWSHDGKYLVAVGTALTQGHGVLQVWDALTGKSLFLSPPLGDADAHLSSCSWAPDSQRVVINLNGTAQVWDISRQKLLYTYKGHSNIVTTVAWSPDGKRIASGSSDKSVQVWNAETGERTFSYFGHSNSVSSVAWSPDSRYIVSASPDGTVQVWLP